MVEPDAHSRALKLDLVVGIGVIYRTAQRVREIVLQRDLAIGPLAGEVGQFIVGVLRNSIDIIRAGTVHALPRSPVPGIRRRQLPPARLIAAQRITPADIGLRDAAIALLIAAGDGHAETVVQKLVDIETRNFRRQFLVVIGAFVIDALDRESRAAARCLQRTRRLDVDGRANTTGRQVGLAGLVDLDTRNRFRSEVAEIKAPGRRRARTIAKRRGRHLAAVEGDEVEVLAEAANRHGAALAKRAVHRNTGDALQRFREVLVRELADVLSGDGVHDALGIALGGERTGERSANAGDRHGLLDTDIILGSLCV